ncbi:MAG TPA: rhomboid family intramembrane serine protease [Bacteroidales bacterium]|nr:rhomboid family intramembrane serine protease [Bacteroidales bacterium]
MESAGSNGLDKKRIKLAIIPSLLVVALIWLSFVIDYTGVFGNDFSNLGIYPGVIKGLRGVVVSPLLHSSFSHLWSNTLPLLIQVWLLFYFYRNIAFPTFIYLWLLSGIITWIIGRSSYHIGASGLVFALLFFLFFSGVLRRYTPLIAVSLVVAFIYGSTIWSIFPIAELVDVTISWEGHLSGAISGLIIAIIFRKQGPQRPANLWVDDDEELEEDEIVENIEASIGDKA